MKVRCLIGIAFAMFLLIGCKAGRKVTERMVRETESRAEWALQDSLQLRGEEVVRQSSEVKQQSEEQMTLWRNGVIYEIQYDTAAKIDSATGKPPVMSERIEAMVSRQDKRSALRLSQVREDSFLREILLRENSNLLLSVDHLTHENRLLKEKNNSPNPFNLKLLLLGMVIGAILTGRFLFRQK